jgi:PAS domain S-box-containing protein
MEEAVVSIARGRDFTMRVPASSSHLEMMPLSVAINQMLDSLCQIQGALKDSETRYSAIVENMNDAVVIIEDGVHIYINRRVVEILGLEEDEIIGKPFTNWIAPECRDATIASYNARMAGKDAPAWYRTKILHKDGHIIPTEISAKIAHINGRKCDILVLHDTTERDTMEQALRESEDRYKMLAENSADVIWLVEFDPHSLPKPVYISPSVEKVLGYTQDEFLCLAEDQMMTPESYSCVVEKTAANVFEFNETGKLSHMSPLKLEMVHKNGTVVSVEVVISLLPDENGRAARMLGISRDITTRVKAEEGLRKYEIIYYSSRVIVLFLDP